MATIYGTGAAAGFPPQQIDAMSIWQFNAAIQGWIKANRPARSGLSDDERDELFDWLEAGTEPLATAPGYAYRPVTHQIGEVLRTSIDWGGGEVPAFVAAVSQE